MKKESKCHAFWKTNRNPITMKKCVDENALHIHNRSKEQIFALELQRAKTLAFDYEHQILTKND